MSDDGFHLLETMRAENGAVALLERHLERLARSAAHFGFRCDIGAARRAVVERAAAMKEPACLRLLVSSTGARELETRPLPRGAPRRLRIAAVRVDSNDPLLRHKTTRRGLYERAREGCGADDDVILVNERDEATETTIANIAVCRNGRWITPPVSSGLLGGVRRSELLAAGTIAECAVEASTLVPGETVRCFNALRGIFDAKFWR
jgi:para-aminobenzoate synthetase/4-amino-4-deoxychorismate lyase